MTAPIPVSRTGATDREVEAVEAALWPFGTPHRRSHESHEQVQRLAELLHAARAAAEPDEDPRIASVLALHTPPEGMRYCPQDGAAYPCRTAALLAEQPGGGR